MASRGVNKVILIGNLGADPEIRYMPSGSAVANLRIATTESWKDQQSGQRQERTEWHRVALFGRLAEIAGEYLRKGSQVYIEGSLRTRKWQGQDGQDRYTTEIVGREMRMLGGRGGDSSAAFDQSVPDHPEAATAPQAGASKPAPSKQAPETLDDFDDDIPF